MILVFGAGFLIGVCCVLIIIGLCETSGRRGLESETIFLKQIIYEISKDKEDVKKYLRDKSVNLSY